MNAIHCNILRHTVAVFFLAACLLPGCSPKPRVSESVLDTPEHHVSSGLKLLRKGYFNDARREFELALQLDTNCSDAVQYQNNLPDAYFYLGVAYQNAQQPMEAEKAFKKVLEINNGLVGESERELKSLHPSK